MSNKKGSNWRFKERYVYCYGGEDAMRMPYRVVIVHRTRRTFYGFICGSSACNFIFDRIPSACSVTAVKDGSTYFYVVSDERIGKGLDIILVSSVDIFDILVDHYRCVYRDFRGL